ncbi:hypothetical protein FRC12_006090 [Ceratobasidium sp. 428]|nr:hypothetical protein FRC12_006090 [Ceratobasidium sp. 428]
MTCSQLPPHSAFHHLNEAKFQPLKLEKEATRKVLLAYGRYQPTRFNAQWVLTNRQTKDTKDIKAYIQDSLSLNKLLPLKTISGEWESERKRLQKVVAEHTTEAADLRDQLQKAQAQYASLHSHLQIQENIEKAEIAQQLADLNRQIDDIGHTTSNYLIDRHVEAGATSLDARDPRGLKAMFLHTEGFSSLVASSTGAGMAAPDFFDYAVRSILCQQLCKYIFNPFHPNVPNPNAIMEVYPLVQSQEPQIFAGRWRKSAFTSISRSIGLAGAVQAKARITEAIVSEKLNPLLSLFFGSAAGVALEKQHFELLGGLVSSAWSLNELLKGSVVLLGDFCPAAYSYGHEFDPDFMSEFEGQHTDETPEYILSTIRLGMLLGKARGEGKDPQTSVFCKASVITEKLFSQPSSTSS